MVHTKRICERLLTNDDVWRPKDSFVETKPLAKVNVAFESPSDHYQSESVSPEMASPRSEHGYLPGNVVRHLGLYYTRMTSYTSPANHSMNNDHVTYETKRPVTNFTSTASHVIGLYNSSFTAGVVLKDDVTLSRSETSAMGRAPRSNILSHMAAKNKTSWVENAAHKREQSSQSNSIQCKGKNPYSKTPYEKSQLAINAVTMGVRDGRRFDLLPISHYLKKHQGDDKSPHKQSKRFPLVRISSYKKVCLLPNLRSYMHSPTRKKKQQATFFTEKDVFKTRESRKEPSRGEALFVDPKDQLPNLYKRQYNAPIVRLRGDQGVQTSKEKVAFPVIS
ncbi:uncharacterized protein LOC5522210 isoform X1 [Nematostella vectensis]|uniref:uncharacterized protein LOC5522210 isoform X1 n=1 Tax=Nematostella vectensis TaxID=45351 RepID=UPI0013904047|nr:uncharacterized protein LOC5522210 isoform X1 [Nematostella vectensis]